MSHRRVLWFGLFGVAVVMGIVWLLTEVRPLPATDARNMVKFIDTAWHALERTGQAPDFPTILDEAKAFPAWSPGQETDQSDEPYYVWGDRAAGETLVIATPGRDRRWHTGEGRADDNPRVARHYLALASALTVGLLQNSTFPDGTTLDLPDLQAISIERAGDDVFLFVDVGLVSYLLDGAAVESDEKNLYRERLRILAAEAATRQGKSPAWSPLATTRLPIGGMTQR